MHMFPILFLTLPYRIVGLFFCTNINIQIASHFIHSAVYIRKARFSGLRRFLITHINDIVSTFRDRFRQIGMTPLNLSSRYAAHSQHRQAVSLSKPDCFPAPAGAELLFVF